MDTNLKKYEKRDVTGKLDSVCRSVNLERKHQEFLEKNRLNFSAMVRDFLDSLILENAERERK